MSSPRIRPIQIQHVALHVRDIERSAAFYCELFGMCVRPATPPGENICVCSAPSGASSSFGIVLMQGLRGGTQPVGMDHISLEVSSADDVEKLYTLAVAHGASATKPRVYGGFYQTYIFDPDGYKIEVAANEPPEKTDVPDFMRRVEPQWATLDRGGNGQYASSERRPSPNRTDSAGDRPVDR